MPLCLHYTFLCSSLSVCGGVFAHVCVDVCIVCLCMHVYKFELCLLMSVFTHLRYVYCCVLIHAINS